MKNGMKALAALLVTTASAQAGGIDRTGQRFAGFFEPGNYAELSFGSVNPSVSGNDVAMFGGGSSGNVAADYLSMGLMIKSDINDRLSFAVVFDQPFGADVTYGPDSVALGGTSASVDTSAITGLLRYKFDGGFSVIGGLRVQKAEASVDLRGRAYGDPATGMNRTLNGYSVVLDPVTSTGYVVGAAYEKPEIALRVMLTYNSAVDGTFDAHETMTLANGYVATLADLTTEVSSPQSVNFDFQTGVAAGTLLFGQIRWVDWSAFKLSPTFFNTATGGSSLVNFEDTYTYTLGVGRKFTDQWSGAFSMTYEAEGNSLVSPLAPTNGSLGFTLAGIYTQDNMKITTGINYTQLGNAQAETADTARAEFTDNSAFGIGVRVGFSF